MRNDRLNYVLVGAFVLAMVAGLVATVAVLSGRTGATDTYYTRFDDATGIKYGTQVLYMGFPVGQVDSIRPVAEDGRVAFELELAIREEFARWGVPRDSVAQVRAAGLLAAITLDIRAGQSEEALRPGDDIRGAGRVDVMAALSDTASTLREITVTSLAPLLDNLNRHVTAIGGVLERRAAPLIENLNVLAAELAGRGPGVIDSFLATSEDLRLVSRRLEQILSEDNADKLGSTMDNVLAASRDLARLTAHARAQLGVLLSDEAAARAGRVLASADAAAADIAHASGVAREGLDRLLGPPGLARMQRTLANVEEASAGARALLGPQRLEQVDEAIASAGSAARGLDGLIAETREQVRTLVSPQTVRRFDAALANVAAAAANVARLSERLDRRAGEVFSAEAAARLRRTLENFSQAAANVAALTRGLEASRGELDALLGALRATAEENRADVRASLLDLRHSLGAVSQHIDAVAQNLEGSSRNMFELSRRLKANPGLLLRGAPPAPAPGEVPAGG